MKIKSNYIGRPRQRVIALAIEEAIEKAELNETQADAVVYSVLDSIEENNERSATGYRNYFGIVEE
jgi:formaldehyde-activating enzyme involved in methanogenesis